MPSNHWLVDLLGRLIMTHDIDEVMIARALHMPDLQIEHALSMAGDVIDELDSERLSLVVNVLIRTELRLRGDSRAMRQALQMPLDALCGATPAAMMAGSLDDLRRVRLAIDHVAAPEERWWRIGHR